MTHKNFTFAGAAFAAVMLVASGCASAPDRPERQLARAETSIEFAEQNGASEYGSTALDRARYHLEIAQNEADEGDHADALRHAEKAELDAELAAAQTSTGKASEALEEIRKSIETLRREIARNEFS